MNDDEQQPYIANVAITLSQLTNRFDTLYNCHYDTAAEADRGGFYIRKEHGWTELQSGVGYELSLDLLYGAYKGIYHESVDHFENENELFEVE